MAEIIYILTNEAMPGYIKIGRTTNLEQRLRSLDSTSIPLPFTCFYAAEVKDAIFVEKQLHEAFGEKRVRQSREFFLLAPERAVAALRLAEINNVTPGHDFVETADDQRALENARRKAERFNFAVAQVPIGARITFTRNPEIYAIVKTNNTIEMNGEETSLSRAAADILTRDYGWQQTSAQGPIYWEYEGETLVERRERLETEASPL